MSFVAKMLAEKGFITDALSDQRRRSERVVASDYGSNRDKPERDDSRQRWRGVFGPPTNKEDSKPQSRATDSFGRSLVGAGPAQARLVQSMRSMAPGGWSDDRWEQSKHFEGIQYLAIHRKAFMASQAEFSLFRKDDNAEGGKRPIKRGETGWDIIKLFERPNRQDHFGLLMYRFVQQMDLTGMHHTWMVPNVLADKILELYSIPTAVAIPQPATNPDYPDGYYRIQPLYPYGPFSTYPTPTTSVGAPVPAQWMMTSKYPHPLLRYDGFAPQTAARLWIDVITQMDRSRFYSQRKAFRPSAVLNFDGMEEAQTMPEPEINRVRTEFENMHQGPENHGTLIVAPPGGKFEEFGASPKDMDWTAGWEQMADAILPMFGMTKPTVGMTGASSYAEYFASIKHVHGMSLKPMLDWYAADVTSRICPFYADDLIFEIRTPRIDDHELLQQKAQLLSEKSAITYNQLLRMYDMPTTDEPWGEERVGMDQQQMQMGMPGAPPNVGMPQPPASATEPGKLNENGPPPPPELKGPTPGKLNEGSLGPRKYLNRIAGIRLGTKSVNTYDRLTKALANGNGHY